MSVPQRFITSKDAPANLHARLNEAADNFDFKRTEGWAAITEISPNAELKEIEVYGTSSIKDGDLTYAPASIYVNFVFHGEEGRIEFPENLLARVYFKVDGDAVEIVRIEPDLEALQR